MAGMLSSVMDMFRGTPQPASQQLNVVGPNGQPMQVQMVPAQGTQQQQQPQVIEPKKEEPPPVLDASFWQIDSKKDQVPQDLSQFSFNIDPKVVRGQVDKLDFTAGISPDLIKKVAAGGEEAVSAMITMMDHVGKNVMHHSVLAGAKVTENGLKSTGERLTRELPNMVRNQNISNALREDNPLFDDPATAPVLAAFEQQVAIKFPSATPQEIKEYSKQYFTNFAQKAAQSLGMEVSTKTKPNANTGASGAQMDWSEEPV